MKKMVIGAIILVYGLKANTIEWEKDIPKNYKISDTYKFDFNKDGVEDILLDLFSVEREEEKVVILKGEKNNKYSIVLESNNILKYPNDNGQGYMIQDISIESFNDNIIVSTSEYEGRSIDRAFYFKYVKDSFYLYQYSESYATRCDNSTIRKSRINDNIQFILKLKDFSVTLFFEKYYSLKFEKNLKRDILANFEENY